MRARGVFRFSRSRDHSRARARMRGVARSPENNFIIPYRGSSLTGRAARGAAVLAIDKLR